MSWSKKNFAFKQQMIIVRFYHYSKSNQVSQCQSQDLKWAPPLAGEEVSSGSTWAVGSKDQQNENTEFFFRKTLFCS
jgi:hypothetical protein